VLYEAVRDNLITLLPAEASEVGRGLPQHAPGWNLYGVWRPWCPGAARLVHPPGSLLGRPPSAALLATSAPALTLNMASILPIRQELTGERVVVTLGTWPEAGDTQQGHTLPAWRELARVLEPWLYMNRPHWSGFSEEDMHR
jgi:Protein of unknown function (DUF3396)